METEQLLCCFFICFRSYGNGDATHPPKHTLTHTHTHTRSHTCWLPICLWRGGGVWYSGIKAIRVREKAWERARSRGGNNECRQTEITLFLSVCVSLYLKPWNQIVRQALLCLCGTTNGSLFSPDIIHQGCSDLTQTQKTTQKNEKKQTTTKMLFTHHVWIKWKETVHRFKLKKEKTFAAKGFVQCAKAKGLLLNCHFVLLHF